MDSPDGDQLILVSACLAGCNCRYDAGNCRHEGVCDLVVKGKAFPVCPEQLAGLPTPRGPHEILTDEAGARHVIDKDGNDYLSAYQKGAERTLAICRALSITQAVLKSNSPSCGCGQIYDGTFSGRLVSGDGLTADLLKRNGINVRSEKDI